jgi:hypothetical protein
MVICIAVAAYGCIDPRRGRDGATGFYSPAEPRIAQACDIVHQIVLDRLS